MDRIEQYFLDEKHTSQVVAGMLAQKLSKYGDIKKEFEWWLEKRSYKADSPITIGGYTAEAVSKIAPQLDPAGVYNFMILLRDNPEKAAQCIKSGFPRK